jgi:hypothetical protein
MENEASETKRAGVWIQANEPGWQGEADIPDGTFAAIVAINEAWFAVDAVGNVRGNPEAVERVGLAAGVNQSLIALTIVGLARLAIKARGKVSQ